MSEKAIELLTQIVAQQQQTLDKLADGLQWVEKILVDATGHPMTAPPEPTVEKPESVVPASREREISEAEAHAKFAPLENRALETFLEGQRVEDRATEHIVFVSGGGRAG